MFKRATTPDDGYFGIELGDLCEDTLTGFSGVCVARSEFITGCNQVALLPRTEVASKAAETHWFDVNRITVKERGRYALPAASGPAVARRFGAGAPPPVGGRRSS